MTSMQRLAALTASLHEFRMRREAAQMGCSYWTRCFMDNPQFQASSASPWSKLPRRTRLVMQRLTAKR